MNRNIWAIYWTALMMLIISCAYFLGIVVHAPIAATLVAVTVAAAYITYTIRNKSKSTLPEPEEKTSLIATAILLLGVGLLIDQSASFATKQGDWDAWAIWNLAAKFLAHPSQWQNMLTYDAHPHPDYPLLLPSLTAFFWNIAHNTSYIAPFAIAATIFFLIPLLIFFELKRNSLLFAALMLFWFATDDFYTKHALSQCADTMLAFFFLAAIIANQYYNQTKDRLYIAIVGACCGACICTKNEGLILALLFAIFNVRNIIQPENLLWFAMGIALPLACLIIFKIGYAPENDLVHHREEITIGYLVDGSRYSLIWESLKTHFGEQYRYHKIAAMVWIVITIIRRKQLGDMALVFSCFIAYLLVYLFTPMDLAWHLNTSFDRLMHQLAPAFMYVFALRFTGQKTAGRQPSLQVL